MVELICEMADQRQAESETGRVVPARHPAAVVGHPDVDPLVLAHGDSHHERAAVSDPAKRVNDRVSDGLGYRDTQVAQARLRDAVRASELHHRLADLTDVARTGGDGPGRRWHRLDVPRAPLRQPSVAAARFATPPALAVAGSARPRPDVTLGPVTANDDRDQADTVPDLDRLDQEADARDRKAEGRDRAAGRRDIHAAIRDALEEDQSEIARAKRQKAANDRTDSADDRRGSGSDRRASAEDRKRARDARREPPD